MPKEGKTGTKKHSGERAHRNNKRDEVEKNAEEQKKESESNTDTEETDEEDIDDLELKDMEVPELPGNVMFPEELNRYLRTQVQVLTSDNGRLRRMLEEQKEELQGVTAKLVQEQQRQNLSPLMGLGRASELAASKIVELSKRVRELSAEVEMQRSRCRTAEAKLVLLQEKEEEGGDTKLMKQENTSTEDGENADDKLKALKDKLQATNLKLCEYRNQNQKLRQELKMTQKILANEVGDSVSIQSLMNGTSTWRGRAQQILSLQQKLAELREQLSDKPTSISVAESRSVSTVRQIEKERRQAHEQTSRELKETVSSLEETTRKLDGARARCKVLESEISGMKMRLTSLVDKGKHDDQLITLLTSQLTAAESRLKQREHAGSQEGEKWNQERSRLEQEVAREKNRIIQLESTLNEKILLIERLSQQALATQDNTSSTHNEQNMNVPPACDWESSTQSTPPSVATDCRSQNEQESMRSTDYHVSTLANEAERTRLMELLAVVNRRVDEQRHLAIHAEEALRRERQKTAKLETKVARLELEKVCVKKSNCYTGNRQQQEKENASEELKYKIELLQEECLALRTRMQCLEQEKQDDLRTYTMLLEQARNTHGRGHRPQNALKKSKASSPPVNQP